MAWKQILGDYPAYDKNDETGLKAAWWKKASTIDWSKQKRKDILDFLQFNDPNGTFTDDHAGPDQDHAEPLTHEEAMEYIKQLFIDLGHDELELVEVEIRLVETTEKRWTIEVPASMTDDYDSIEDYFRGCIDCVVDPKDTDYDDNPQLDIEFV